MDYATLRPWQARVNEQIAPVVLDDEAERIDPAFGSSRLSAGTPRRRRWAASCGARIERRWSEAMSGLASNTNVANATARYIVR
jgi:hypothetical protein